MRYEEARPRIKSGDILGWQGHSLFSRLTQRVTRSAYSHVGTAWVVGKRVFVLESLGSSGVRLMPLSQRRPFYHVATKSKWLRSTEVFALEKLSARYGWIDALYAGLGIPMVDKRGWICSEYSAAIARMCGHPIPSSVQTPAELIKWCEKKDFRISYVE